MRRFLALVLLPVALVAVPAAQIVPSFKSQTDLVDVDVVVTDSRGDPVQALDRSHFVVEEDGRPVAISTFAEVDADRATSTGDGRFIVLLIAPRFVRTGPIARMIVDRMTPHDVMAILSTTGSAGRTTTDKAAVVEQLSRLERDTRRVPSAAARRSLPGGASSPVDCIECAQSPLNPDSPDASRALLPAPRPPASLSPGASGARSSNVLEMIADVTKQLKTVRRRKMLVYVGNASALELRAGAGYAGLWFDAVGSASRAEVEVSVIDPDGPTGRPFDGARGFARETGGEAFVNRSDLDGVVDRIWRDAGHYYVLGYAPPSAKKARHTMRVRLDRQELNVRARQQR